RPARRPDRSAAHRAPNDRRSARILSASHPPPPSSFPQKREPSAQNRRAQRSSHPPHGTDKLSHAKAQRRQGVAPRGEAALVDLRAFVRSLFPAQPGRSSDAAGSDIAITDRLRSPVQPFAPWRLCVNPRRRRLPFFSASPRLRANKPLFAQRNAHQPAHSS